MKVINSCLVLLALLGLASGSKWEVTGWQLHRLVPNDQGQVDLLKALRNSNSGVMFWNGIGDIGDPVDILSSKDAFEHFQEHLEDKQLGVYDYNQYIKVKLLSSDVNVHLNNDTSPEPLPPTPTTSKFPHSPPLIPIHPIKDTTLYSGLFYKILMPSFPSGWVTWTNKETQNKQGNYVQIDINPKNLPFYIQGQKWYEDIQWAFIPSEKEGYYTLTLKGDLSAMVTSTFEQESGHEYNHVVLAKARDFIQRISLGGEERDAALWRPIPTGQDSYNQLKLKSFPDTAMVTWTSVKYGDFSHYIQVSTNPKDHQKYLPGGEWYNDTLFQFTPTDIKLHGVVTFLEFIPDPSHPLNYDRLVIKRFKLKNNGPTKILYNLTEKVSLANEIGIDSFESIVNLREYLDSPVELDASFPNFGSDEKLQRKGYDIKESGQSRKTELNEYTLRNEVEVGPESGAEVTVFADRIGGNVPLNALLCIKGTTDRIVGDLSTIQEGSVTGNVVRDELSRRGYKQVKDLMMGQDAMYLWAQGTIQGKVLVDAGIVTEAVVKMRAEGRQYIN